MVCFALTLSLWGDALYRKQGFKAKSRTEFTSSGFMTKVPVDCEPCWCIAGLGHVRSWQAAASGATSHKPQVSHKKCKASGSSFCFATLLIRV